MIYNNLSASPRQNDSNKFSDNFLVSVTSSAQRKSVIARLPEEVGLSISSDWDTALSAGVSSSSLGIVLNEATGLSTKTQMASAQVWSGNSPIEITLPLEFYAQEDPSSEVIDPIISLAKMCLPKRSGVGVNGGLLTPPGPRIFNFNNRANDQITITIGKFAIFTKVIVLAVNPTFITRDMGVKGMPLRATCELTFRSIFSLTGEDFERMFQK